jgi:DNA-binding MarR family transcriptional regulator
MDSKKEKSLKFHGAAYFTLGKTADGVGVEFKKILDQFKLTHQQFNILRILKGSFPKPLSASEIKERMIFKNSDVTRLMDRLTAKEYIKRETCPSNRRKIDILITQKGLELLNEIAPSAQAFVETFFKNKITRDEAKELYRILNKIKS